MVYVRHRQMFVTGIILIVLIAIIPVSIKAQDNELFQDVNEEHWGYESILWAKDQGIVDGYPDGTFKPDAPVGQTEFLAMLIRAYNPKDFLNQQGDDDWRTPYKQYAFKMGWGGSYIVPPSSKLSSSNDPEINIPRMYVAKLITNVNGRSYSFKDSIRFLLDSGISEGKTDNSVEGFQGYDLLTRAEAVKFIRHVKTKLDYLYPSPALLDHPYDPNTLKLSPIEAAPLDINHHPDEQMADFTQLDLEHPSSGYTLTHKPSYTVTGTVRKAIGDDLAIEVERWDSGAFVPVSSLRASMKDGKVNQTIELPTLGIYRISLYSQQVKSEQEIALTSFYIEYREEPDQGAR